MPLELEIIVISFFQVPNKQKAQVHHIRNSKRNVHNNSRPPVPLQILILIPDGYKTLVVSKFMALCLSCESAGQYMAEIFHIFKKSRCKVLS